MNYLGAARKGTQPHPANEGSPQVSRKAEKVEEEQPTQEIEQVAEIPPVEDKIHQSIELLGNNGGPFSDFTNTAIKLLAEGLGPQGVCSIGLTCKYLFSKFLVPQIWQLVSYRIPKTTKPIINFMIDFSKEDDADVEEGDSSPKSFPISHFERSGPRNQLFQSWLKIVQDAQSERDKKYMASEAKKAANPDDLMNTTSKPPVKVSFGGGFSFAIHKEKDIVEEILHVQDLSQVQPWLDATVKLLEGEHHVDIPHGNEVVELSRVGRGGDLIHFKLGNSAYYFKFSDFALGIREAAKEFTPLVGRFILYVKFNSPKEVDKVEAAKSYLECEKTIASVLKHKQSDDAVKLIKKWLEAEAIPRAYLSDYFKRQDKEKKRVDQQKNIEYENIMEFVMNNLPSDYEKTLASAQKLNTEAEKDRDKQRQERRVRDQEKRKQAVLAETTKKEPKKTAQPVFEGWKAPTVEDDEEWGIAEDKPKPKVVKKVKKEVDEHGWITEKVEVVVDGVLKAPAVEEKKEEPTKKKNKKNKTLTPEQQFQLQRQQQIAQKKKEEEISAAYLETNPFSVVMHDSAYESIADTLHQKNMNKGKARNDENNRVLPKQKKKGQQGKATPKQPQQKQQAQKDQTAQPKKQEQKKQDQKKQKPKSKPEEDQSRVKQLARNSKKKPFNITNIYEHEMFQPVAVALSVVAVIALTYTFIA